MDESKIVLNAAASYESGKKLKANKAFPLVIAGWKKMWLRSLNLYAFCTTKGLIDVAFLHRVNEFDPRRKITRMCVIPERLTQSCSRFCRRVISSLISFHFHDFSISRFDVAIRLWYVVLNYTLKTHNFPQLKAFKNFPIKRFSSWFSQLKFGLFFSVYKF